MPAFTNLLKKENKLLQLGLELFKAYGNDFEKGQPVAVEDLRVAVYAMQIAFEKSHLAKEEAFLYPALKSSEVWKTLSPEAKSGLERRLRNHDLGRQCLLELRLTIDQYDRDPQKMGLVSWRLKEFVDHLNTYLEKEDRDLLSLADEILNPAEQKTLYHLAQNFEHHHGLENLQGPRLIFSRLRSAKGMSAA